MITRNMTARNLRGREAEHSSLDPFIELTMMERKAEVNNPYVGWEEEVDNLMVKALAAEP